MHGELCSSVALATPAGVFYQLQDAPCTCEAHMEDSVKVLCSAIKPRNAELRSCARSRA